jgi:restriction endonuclease Mrr
MLSPLWTERLLKIPGARKVKAHLLQQGHTEDEANVGAVMVAGLVIFLLVILFNTFVFGIIRGFFQNAWGFCEENPVEAVLIGILGTMMLLAILFQYLRRSTKQQAEKNLQARRDRHKIEEKREHLRRGAMGNAEELFRFYLSEKYPDIEVKSVHMVDTVPRIRFQVRRFNTELGGKVDKNYELFRDGLFWDTLRVLEVAFFLSENIPAVIVDAMMSFISGKAKYYDGMVLSVKAQRNVFEHTQQNKVPPFKALTSFDLRYNDGMEVKAIPVEESKSARVIERIKENAPKLNIRYEETKTKVDEGWEKPKATEEPLVIQETLRGKEFSSMPLAQFQDLVLNVLGKMNFEAQKVKRVPGGTLQIQADFSHPLVGGSFLVLARQYPETAPVHADLIRELDEVAREEACKRGIYIVTGRFTEEAKNISRTMAVDLVDGAKLTELMEGPSYDGRWTFRVVDEKGVVTDLSRMPLLNFEKEVDLFLKSMGFRVEKIRRVPGGAVVAVAEFPHPVIGGKFCVMGKQFQPEERVPAELVSEMSHVMKSEFCYRGLLMVPADYAMEARALARFSNVELVDRHTWENLRRQL